MIRHCQSDPTINLIWGNMQTKGFCGTIFFGNKIDTIVLNKNRSKFEQNFDFTHETVHKFKHRRLGKIACGCLTSCQNSFIEWEANEGSAELLVPYRKLLPLIREQLPDSPSCMEIVHLKKRLADQFQVSDAVIHYRLESLKYEIFQYLDWDRPLEKLEILSATQQRNRGIIVSSLNDIENEKFSEEFQAHIRSKNNKIIV